MRRGHRNRLAAFASCVVIATIASACGGSSDSGGGAASGDPGTLVDGGTLTAQPKHLDPALVSVLEDLRVTNALYDGLTDFDFTNPDKPELKGLLAESWTNNDDGSVWTFKLKPGMKFSNGEEVLPSSFVRAWNRAASPDLAGAYGLLLTYIKGGGAVYDGKTKEISGVKADDAARTLTVTLEAPNAEFPAIVSHVVFSPMPKAVDELSDQTKWEQGAMIGNGPFKMAGPKNASEIVLERNDSWGGNVYGDKKAKLDKIRFKISKDVDSAWKTFEAGEADTAVIPTGLYSVAKSKYATATDPQLGTNYFLMNMADPVIGGADNVQLRQAITLAINRDKIEEALFEGVRTAADGLTPPGIPGKADDLCDYCDYNLDEAKKLLGEWENDGNSLTKPLKVQFESGQGQEDLVARVVDNLNEAGIDAEADPRSDKYTDELYGGGCQICRSAWGYDYPVYENGLTGLFTSDGADGGPNFAQLKDPKVDELVGQASGTLDAGERYDLLQQAEKRILNDDVVVAPIDFYSGDQAYSKSVKDYVMTPLSLVLWEKISID